MVDKANDFQIQEYKCSQDLFECTTININQNKVFLQKYTYNNEKKWEKREKETSHNKQK